MIAIDEGQGPLPAEQRIALYINRLYKEMEGMPQLGYQGELVEADGGISLFLDGETGRQKMLTDCRDHLRRALQRTNNLDLEAHLKVTSDGQRIWIGPKARSSENRVPHFLRAYAICLLSKQNGML